MRIKATDKPTSKTTAPAPNKTPSVRLIGFPPVHARNARVLVLGSMPGEASLRAAQYYAHPQNKFWPMMGELVGASPMLPYQQRLNRLTGAGIALWDVLASCEREGSLDSAIRDETAEINDFASLFSAHPRVGSVLFNGAKAEHAFRRFALGALHGRDLKLVRLPSTSPANASQPYSTKLMAWREALGDAGAKLIV